MAPVRCRLNHEQKNAICKFSVDNPSMAQADLVSYFNNKWSTAISRSAMSSILKNKSKWLAVDSNTASKMSERRCANKMLEDVLHLWFITNGPSGKGGDINGDIIKEMAADLANDPRFEVDPNFKFSNGWFDGFKKRYNIKQYKRHGECASSDADAIGSGRQKIASLIAQYPRKLVYNMDETAKRHNLRPSYTYATSSVGGYKQSKERLTVAVCANADGSHKVGLYIIGNAKTPRSFTKDWTPCMLVLLGQAIRLHG